MSVVLDTTKPWPWPSKKVTLADIEFNYKHNKFISIENMVHLGIKSWNSWVRRYNGHGAK